MYNLLTTMKFQIDHWLYNYGCSRASFTALEILQGFKDPGFDSVVQPCKKAEDFFTQRSKEDMHVTPDDGLRALLIYRAVLFAALCSTAADTSCVEGTELGERVVQFI